MTDATFSFRTLLALIVLAVVTIVCASLGQWQLGRAAEREAIHTQIIAGRERSPLDIESATPADQLLNWRPAKASGHWMNRHTVLLANRNLNGKPGYWVATPLRLDDQNGLQASGKTPDSGAAEATRPTAILVLRGWIPRPVGPNARWPKFGATDARVSIEGELRERVPRLFDLGQVSGNQNTGLPKDPAAAEQPLELQNLELENFTAVTGIKLVPAVLQQTSPDALNDGTVLVQQWPTPSLDSDKNRGYALQWFAFAAIAAGALLVILWRTLRRRQKHST